MAALVIAYTADQRHFVSQLMGVGGKVERSAAQVLGGADDVPQDLANADDAQALSSSSIVACRVANTAALPESEPGSNSTL